MTDHADLTARLRAWADAWDDLHGDRLATASTIRADGQTHALRSADVRLLLDALDAADAENARLRAALFDVTHAVMQEAEAHRYGQPAYDMTLDHLYEIADHHRSVLAVSEEATDV